MNRCKQHFLTRHSGQYLFVPQPSGRRGPYLGKRLRLRCILRGRGLAVELFRASIVEKSRARWRSEQHHGTSIHKTDEKHGLYTFKNSSIDHRGQVKLSCSFSLYFRPRGSQTPLMTSQPITAPVGAIPVGQQAHHRNQDHVHHPSRRSATQCVQAHATVIRGTLLSDPIRLNLTTLSFMQH